MTTKPKLAWQQAFKNKLGIAQHPSDLNPELFTIAQEELKNDFMVWLERTRDYGETWQRVGYWERNSRGGWILKWVMEDDA